MAGRSPVRERENSSEDEECDSSDANGATAQRQGFLISQQMKMTRQISRFVDDSKLMSPEILKKPQAAFSVVKAFRDFILQDEVINLAVGIVLGEAFVAIVNSVVVDLVTPFIALCGGGGNLDQHFIVLRYGKNNTGPYSTLEEATKAEAITWNYGRFLQSIVVFLIIALTVFLIINLINFVKRNEEKGECPKCKETVHIEAVRCPHCTAEPINVNNGDDEQLIPTDRL